jgi:hypothetical protein
MKTANIDKCNFKAVCFFKSMGYKLDQLKSHENSLEAKKYLTKTSAQVSEWVEDNLDWVFRPHSPSI